MMSNLGSGEPSTLENDPTSSLVALINEPQIRNIQETDMDSAIESNAVPEINEKVLLSSAVPTRTQQQNFLNFLSLCIATGLTVLMNIDWVYFQENDNFDEQSKCEVQSIQSSNEDSAVLMTGMHIRMLDIIVKSFLGRHCAHLSLISFSQDGPKLHQCRWRKQIQK
jgi:hypothetical protein